MQRRLAALVLFAALTAVTAPAGANPIFVESFSLATTSGSLIFPASNTVDAISERWASTLYYTGPVVAPGWEFGGQTILAESANGDRAILLNESPHATASNSTIGIGGLVVGQTYELLFDHWGDNRPGGMYSFSVSIGSLSHAIFRTYLIPGPGVTADLFFTATATTETLRFADTSPGVSSPIIDNIVVQAVPEPASLLLLGTGLIGAVRVVRKRCR